MIDHADVEAKDNDGKTALYLTAEKGQATIVKLLIENEANIEASDDLEWTVLMITAFRGQDKVVQVLLEKGANVKAKSKDGRAPMQLAGSNDEVKRLLALYS
jgi:ankyrin repeat protein